MNALFLVAALALPALPYNRTLTHFNQLRAIVEINGDFEFFLTPHRPGKGWRDSGATLEDHKLWFRGRNSA